MSDMVYDPHWGVIMAWTARNSEEKVGPYVARGPGFDSLFHAAPVPAVLDREARDRWILAHTLETNGDQERARLQYQVVVQQFPGSDAAKDAERRLKGLK